MFFNKYQLCLICISLLCISQITLASESHDHHRHDHDHDHASHADGDSAFYGHLDVKLHADNVIKAEGPDTEIEEVYTHSHFEMGFRLGKGFSVNTNIKLEGEPGGHSHAHGGEDHDEEGYEDDMHEEEDILNDNRFFDDHPLYIEHLTLNYDSEHISAYAGKFNPVVGFDYHGFPGAYTYQTIESYAIRERIGFGVKFKHHTDNHGSHHMNISTFFADTSALSNAIFDKREGRLRKEDGGVSNTEDFSSFTLSLGGNGLYPLHDDHTGEGLSYRLGYAKQKAGEGGERDERRHSFSLAYKHSLSEHLTAKLIGEYVDIEYLNGEKGHDRAYTSLALGLDYHQWNVSVAYTDIDNDASEAAEDHDGDVFQMSAGYRFANGIGMDLGYQRSDEEDEVRKRIGLLVSYSYEL